MATRTWYTTCTSSDWPNPEHRSIGKKNCPYLKGLPPSHHLIGKGHSITNHDVPCGRGVLFPVDYWTPHRSLKIKNREKRTLNCLRQRVWLDVSTFDQCLFTTKQIGFVLILICETSQIFVWRNKAFIFLQKSDIVLSVFLSFCLQKETGALVGLPDTPVKPRSQFCFLVLVCLSTDVTGALVLLHCKSGTLI